MTRHPDRERSRAVLIGVADYDAATPVGSAGHATFGLGLPPLEAVANNLSDLNRLLTDPDQGTFASDHCFVLENPSDQNAFGRAVRSATQHADDVLLVYYSGHGLVDQWGRLYLSLTGSSSDNIEWSSVSFDLLREAISSSPAAVRILILDCCFAGRAFESMGSEAVENALIGQIDIHGTYTLVSSAANEPSIAPSGHRNTAFTEAFLTTVREVPGQPLSHLYPRIVQRLRSKGFPRPHQRTIDNAGELVLFGAVGEVAQVDRTVTEVSVLAEGDHRGPVASSSPTTPASWSAGGASTTRLTYAPLLGHAEFSWVVDWPEAATARPQYRACIELHIRSLQDTFIPARLMRTLSGPLIDLLRSTGALRPEAGVTPTVTSDAVTVGVPAAQPGGYNQTYPSELLGVRVDRRRQWSTWWTPPGDMLGAILDEQELTATIATRLRMLGAVTQVDETSANDRDRYVIAIGLSGATGSISEDKATGAPRTRASIRHLRTAEVRVDPDESVSSAAFDIAADQVARTLVDSLIEAFRGAQ
ncbi:caspase family protein [Nocardia takedensis]|uniref:caspase family protein n=1 Tax=Nocardia takedensis TaxID=259390 RepID=UPI003F75E6D6